MFLAGAVGSQAHAGEVVLSAAGYGADEESARAAALNALSERVAVTVESDQEVRTTLADDEVSEEMDARIASRARGFFEGVEYSDPEAARDDYRVEARLRESGVLRTLESLLRQVDRDYGRLDAEEIEAVTDRADFGLALVPFAAEPDAAAAEEAAEQLAAHRDEAIQYLDYARLTPDLIPDEAELHVGDRVLDNRQEQLVPPGRYRYRAKADGYRTERRRIDLVAHTHKTLEIELVPVAEHGVALDLPEDTRSAVAGVLGRHDIEVDAHAERTVQLRIEQRHLSRVADQDYYALEARIEAHRGGQPVAEHTGGIDRVAEGDLEERRRALAEALTEAVISGESGEALLQ
ncbi:hypothetical protein CKO14_10505 [Halorhodospira halophila]|nr:hypothetical protein [Halorhodospira halophila]